MELRLRRARSGDRNQIVHIFRQSIEGIPESIYTLEQKEAWIQKGLQLPERWLEKIEKQFFIVALQNKTVVGFGSLELPGYIDYLFVSPDFQKMGIASKILEELERMVIDLQASELQTDSSKAALPFFRSHGFEIVREQHKFVSNIDIVNYRLIKRL